MFDHLAKGRFILGVSPGALASDAEVARHPRRGPQQDVRRGDRRHPRDLGGRAAVRHRLPGQPVPGRPTATTLDLDLGVGVLPKPLQHPAARDRRHGRRAVLEGRDRDGRAGLPPAVGATSCCPSGWRRHWPNYVEGKESVGAGRRDRPTGGSPARSSSPTTTRRPRRYGRSTTPNSPYRFYYSQMLDQDAQAGPPRAVQDPREQPDDEITLDYVLDDLVIAGTPDVGGRAAAGLPRGDR